MHPTLITGERAKWLHGTSATARAGTEFVRKSHSRKGQAPTHAFFPAVVLLTEDSTRATIAVRLIDDGYLGNGAYGMVWAYVSPYGECFAMKACIFTSAEVPGYYYDCFTMEYDMYEKDMPLDKILRSQLEGGTIEGGTMVLMPAVQVKFDHSNGVQGSSDKIPGMLAMFAMSKPNVLELVKRTVADVERYEMCTELARVMVKAYLLFHVHGAALMDSKLSNIVMEEGVQGPLLIDLGELQQFVHPSDTFVSTWVPPGVEQMAAAAGYSYNMGEFSKQEGDFVVVRTALLESLQLISVISSVIEMTVLTGYVSDNVYGIAHNPFCHNNTTMRKDVDRRAALQRVLDYEAVTPREYAMRLMVQLQLEYQATIVEWLDDPLVIFPDFHGRMTEVVWALRGGRVYCKRHRDDVVDTLE